MKRILITGGAGFIGSHLSERLLKEGNEIICLDNMSTGNVRNVIHLRGDSRFALIEHDVIDPYYVEHDIDEIYNLACPASPIQYQIDPIKTLKTSVVGAINMLGMAKLKGSTILQASTSEVYGDPRVHPQPETYWGNVNPLGPRSCYDEGKRCAETLFLDYRIHHNTRTKIVRIFNTYGPHMNIYDGRVVSNFIVQALKGEDITVFGDGSQTRSFQYVDDLIEGLVQMMSTSSIFFGPVNIGNPVELTMLDLAEAILKLTGSKSKIVHLPLPKDDPIQRRPDISLATKELNGWRPKVQLEEGLKNTIEWFEGLLREA